MVEFLSKLHSYQSPKRVKPSCEIRKRNDSKKKTKKKKDKKKRQRLETQYNTDRIKMVLCTDVLAECCGLVFGMGKCLVLHFWLPAIVHDGLLRCLAEF